MNKYYIDLMRSHTYRNSIFTVLLIVLINCFKSVRIKIVLNGIIYQCRQIKNYLKKILISTF